MSVLSHSASTVLTGSRRRVLPPLAVGTVALIGAGYVTAVDPNAAGHYPACPFLAVTGWYCPGCGALRAVHALGQGDVMTALARNPFAVAALGLPRGHLGALAPANGHGSASQLVGASLGAARSARPDPGVLGSAKPARLGLAVSRLSF